MKGTDQADAPLVVGGRWARRRGLAWLVRAGVVLVPIVAAVAAGVTVSHLLPGATTFWALVGWWAVVLAATLVTQALVQRLARRALPLAALLRLSLVFPDRAPSRFAIALRSHSTRRAQRELAALASHGQTDRAAAVSSVLLLVARLGVHDRVTRGHSERVRAYVDLIADELDIQGDDRDLLSWAALLHDIGKTDVPAAVLNNPGRLDDAGWDAVHRHPEAGARLIAPLRSWLGPWALAVEQHHERLDGSGYPLKLSGPALSRGARIVAVADSFEVITAPRPYKSPRSPAEARAELARKAGTDFDPEVVRAFLNIGIGRLRWVLGPMSWLAEIPFVGGVARLRHDFMTIGTSAAATTASLFVAVGVVAGGASAHAGRAHVAALGNALAGGSGAVGSAPAAGDPAGGANGDIGTGLLAEPSSPAGVASTSTRSNTGTSTPGPGTPASGAAPAAGGSALAGAPASGGVAPSATTPVTTPGSTTVPAPPTATTTTSPAPATPVVAADSASGISGQALPMDPLANDTGGGGTLDRSSLTIAQPPAHGTATVLPNSKVVYQSANDFVGVDTFVYRVCDVGGGCSTGTVTINVVPEPAG